MECIARGYLFGGAWAEYRERGHGAGPRDAGRAAGGRAAARAALHPDDQGRRGPRPADVRRRGGRRSSARRRSRPSRSARSRVYERRRRATPPSGASSSPTRSSSWARADGELLLIDEVLTPDSSRVLAGRGLRAGELAAELRQAVRARPLPHDRLGPDRRRRRRSRPSVIAGTRAPLRRGVRAAHRPSLADWYGPTRSTRLDGASFAARGRDHPPPRHPRSAGRDGRAGAPGARLRERRRRCTSARASGWSSTPPTRDAARAQVDEMCDRLLANPVIEAYDVEITELVRDAIAAMTTVGVVQFPGHELRARRRARGRAARRRRPSSSCTPTRRSRGVDAVVVPGGFAHGDYLRTGAIARFSPVMDAVAEFAAAGGPVVGICNGFQVLSEAGPAPGRAAEERGPEVPLRDGRPPGRDRRLRAHEPVRSRRRCCASRSTTSRATTSATRPTLDGSGPRIGSWCATSTTRTGASTTSRASATRPATSSGSCRTPSARRTRSSAPPTACCCSESLLAAAAAERAGQRALAG